MDKRYFAEFNTDKIIRESYFPDFSYRGTMIEVGGGTPSFISMSRHWKLNNWRCLIVEPNPKYAEMHRKMGNELYEYACSNENKDDVNFQIVHLSENYDANKITDHSYSAIKVKKGYLARNKLNIKQLPVIDIKVKVRKLDTVLDEAKLTSVDFVSIDVEGWELEVMSGFSTNKYQPKVVLLENYLHDQAYINYMRKVGYKLDKKIRHNYVFVKAT